MAGKEAAEVPVAAYWAVGQWTGPVALREQRVEVAPSGGGGGPGNDCVCAGRDARLQDWIMSLLSRLITGYKVCYQQIAHAAAGRAWLWCGNAQSVLLLISWAL